ncbi:unnamed protein product [Schistosoma guineensis]|nr:unnamed protein product [Schistosoma guineensis]
MQFGKKHKLSECVRKTKTIIKNTSINNSNVIKRQQCTTKGINRNKVQVYTWRDFHQHTKDSKWILQWSSATTKSQMLPIYCRGFVI